MDTRPIFKYRQTFMVTKEFLSNGLFTMEQLCNNIIQQMDYDAAKISRMRISSPIIRKVEFPEEQLDLKSMDVEKWAIDAQYIPHITIEGEHDT